jgi:hypothetical protein
MITNIAVAILALALDAAAVGAEPVTRAATATTATTTTGRTTGRTTTATSSPSAIRPGEIWLDDRGRPVQAHGGGVLQHGDTFYFFGEDRSRENDLDFRYVACYASKDLLHWTFRKQVLKLAAVGGVEGVDGRLVLERPKVFYHAGTKKFVMYMHIDGNRYRVARVGVAVCDTPDGDYQFLRSFRPLGHESRDIGAFVDDDGSAYLIFEDRPNGFHIAKLSDDYLDVARDVCLIRAKLEGGAIVRHDDLYYCLGSALTGWNPNPNKYATAKQLEGPWSDWKDIAPPEKKTWGAQSTFLLKIAGSRATTVIFMGDLWRPRTQRDSRYLWMPLEIGDGRMRLPEPREWKIDVKTGEAVILPPATTGRADGDASVRD